MTGYDGVPVSGTRGGEGIPVLVASRTSSKRLPGKALMELNDKPLLAWVVDAARAASEPSAVVVATSTAVEDDAIADWCLSEQVECLRGPREDVASRLLGIADYLSVPAFVRISGDSPLMDPNLIDRAIQLYRASGADLVTNVYPRTFPKGQSVEVVTTEILRKLLGVAPTARQREHVTQGLYECLLEARIVNFTADNGALSGKQSDFASCNLSVDTLDDFRLVETIISQLKPTSPERAGWHACWLAAQASSSQGEQ
jgi:spore coat polysaccharide biosynthesis protein SpsF